MDDEQLAALAAREIDKKTIVRPLVSRLEGKTVEMPTYSMVAGRLLVSQRIEKGNVKEWRGSG